VCRGFYDNGAYGDWTAGRPFDEARFRAEVQRMRTEDRQRPDFIVAPDIVAGGAESLARSVEWLPQLADVAPIFLAVQDGMTTNDVRAAASGFGGLFVGGTTPWKLQTGATWVALAADLGVPCHVARVGSAKRVKWAKRIGASSIDSCLPLFAERNLRRFLGALANTQTEMPF
jgi:hypothetical protein